MTSSTNPASSSTPDGDVRKSGHSDGIQASAAGPSSIDEIIKATAAWLLIPRPGVHEPRIQIDDSAVVRTDTEWATAAEAYLDAARVFEAARASHVAAKMALCSLTRNPQERGCGVAVTIPGRWSEIDPVEAMALLRVDPQRYWDHVRATVSADL